MQQAVVNCQPRYPGSTGRGEWHPQVIAIDALVDFDGRKLFSGFSVHERTFYTNYRYIGPPQEALLAVRKELGLADLGKPASADGDR